MLFTSPGLRFTAFQAHFVAARWQGWRHRGKVRPNFPQAQPNHPPLEPAMQLTPVIAVHLSAALLAVVTGPVALWARRGSTPVSQGTQRPRVHRAFGYAWVTLMIVTAVSALFIRDFQLPNLNGFTPIHLLIPVTIASLVGAFVALARRDISKHKKLMQRLYISACLITGLFTLLPGRYLGQLVWGQWLGLV
jgi:uncharacterized membrane protein